MPTISIPSGPVSYELQGEGPPLLLLHANPGSHHDYDAVLPRLSLRYSYSASAIPSSVRTWTARSLVNPYLARGFRS